MILYPTTLLFQLVWAMERALAGLLAGKPMPEGASVTLDHFEEVVALPEWAAVEKRFST